MRTKREIIWLAVILVLVWLIVYGLSVKYSPDNTASTSSTNQEPVAQQPSAPQFDLADASYNVNGTEFVLKDGVAATSVAPGSASQATLTLYQSTYGDINNNRRNDSAVILINEPGGSGDFTYVAATLDDGTAIPGVFLGDRIETDGIIVRNEIITVYYKDRKPNQAMSAAPTVSKIARFVLTNGRLKAQ